MPQIKIAWIADAVEGATVYTFIKTMWWKIFLGVIALAVIGFIGMVIKMAVTEAKEETKDIERASK